MDLPFDLSHFRRNNFPVIKFENDDIEKISDSFFLDTFHYLSFVETFSFQGNKLKKIPEKFFQNFEEISNLDLSKNQFENIANMSLTNGKFIFLFPL
jgi:hypothetical protein